MEIPSLEGLENLNEIAENETRKLNELAETDEQRVAIEAAGRMAMEALSGAGSLEDMLSVVRLSVEKIDNKELKEKFEKALKR